MAFIIIIFFLQQGVPQNMDNYLSGGEKIANPKSISLIFLSLSKSIFSSLMSL